MEPLAREISNALRSLLALQRGSKRAQEVALRFFAKAAAPDENGCRRWLGSTSRIGYGQLKVGGALVQAHRVALWLADESFDPRLDALHSCDHRWCVAAEHLRAGTHAENLREMAERGRSSRGEQRWSAKLTERSVLEMRRLYGSGARVADLAKRFGVAHATAWRAVTGRQWGHIGRGDS